MTTNRLRDVRDLALSGRLRAIGGRKGSARPNSCRDRSNHRCIADREESQDKDSFHRMREDRLGLRRGRSGSGQNDYRGAYTRRQPASPIWVKMRPTGLSGMSPLIPQLQT